MPLNYQSAPIDNMKASHISALAKAVLVLALSAIPADVPAASHVIAWGDFGWTNVPPDLTNAVAIAASSSVNLALKADGTIAAWGGNGWTHSLALIGDGPPVQHASTIDPRWESGHFACSIPTESGRVYQLEFKDSLSDPDWTPLPLVAGNGGLRTLRDRAVAVAQRFYRVQRW